MTERDIQIKAYQEYIKARESAELRRPSDLKYKITDTNGNETGEMLYRIVDDTMLITVDGSIQFSIQAKYLKSIRAALTALVGDK